jgi:hypothetical protein
MKLKFIILLICCSILYSCKKDDHPICGCTSPTYLNLFVKDTLGNVVSGASVKLYSTQTDWINQTNQLGNTLISDSVGRVDYYTTLTPAVNYYWLVQKGGLSNQNNVITNTTAIIPNSVNSFNTVISK